jgi:hypothetical protein
MDGSGGVVPTGAGLTETGIAGGVTDVCTGTGRVVVPFGRGAVRAMGITAPANVEAVSLSRARL